MSEAEKAAKARYRKNKVWKLYLDFYPGTDGDIIQWLEKQPSKAGAVKEACRKQIKQCMADAETSAPVDTEPETSAPVDTEPETSAPVDTSAETSAPVDTEPETSAPVDTEPETSAPVDTEPETSAPVDTEPETSASVDTDAETSAPVDTKPEAPNLADIMEIKDLASQDGDETNTLYEVIYLTKKGGNQYHTMNVYAPNAKEAVKNFKSLYVGVYGHAFRIKARKPYEPEKAGSTYPETSDILPMYKKIPSDHFLTSDFALNELRKDAIQKAAAKGKKVAIVRAGNRVWKYATESGELIEAGYNPMK